MDQARLAYLTQMAELISYSGRSYNATMLVRLDKLYCSFIASKERGNWLPVSLDSSIIHHSGRALEIQKRTWNEYLIWLLWETHFYQLARDCGSTFIVLSESFVRDTIESQGREKEQRMYFFSLLLVPRLQEKRKEKERSGKERKENLLALMYLLLQSGKWKKRGIKVSFKKGEISNEEVEQKVVCTVSTSNTSN